MLAYPALLWGRSILISKRGNGYGTKMSPRNQNVSLVESQHHVINTTNPSGALYNGIEDRLKISRRACDHPQNVPRSRLPCERLVELPPQ